MRPGGWLVLALLGVGPPAHAERPLPSYRSHLGIEAWYEVNALIEQASRLQAEVDPDGDPAVADDLRRQSDALLRQAIGRASAFEEAVTPTSGLAYLRGLAWRILGQTRKAEAAWRTSIERDPDGAIDAWHDLGELLLARGDHDAADEAFSHVTAGLPSGPQSWRGPLRQAEVAGWRGDPEALEAHLREALARGYQMPWIRTEPQWRTFYADPRLHDVVERYARVYGSRELLRELARPAP